MPQLRLLRFQVFLCAVGRRNFNRNTFDDLNTGRGEGVEFLRIVCHEPHTQNPKLPQRGGTKVIVSVIGFESEMVIRFDGVLAGILKLVSQKLVHQPNSTALLELINQNSASMLGDRVKREMELFAAVTSCRTKHIACQAL